MIEIVPILAIFILIVNFALGFFGLVHSGILNSIAARNYAFETFRNRSDLTYLRDDGSDATFTYAKSALRYHVTRSEASQAEDYRATRRPIKFSDINALSSGGSSDEMGLTEHDTYKKIQEKQSTSTAGDIEGTNNPWIKTAYGICLTAQCGGS